MTKRRKVLAGFGVLAGVLAIIGVGLGSPASTAPPTGILGPAPQAPPIVPAGLENTVQMGLIHNGRCVHLVVPELPSQAGAPDWAAVHRMLPPIDPKLHKAPVTAAEKASRAAEVEKCRGPGPAGIPMKPQ